MTRKPGYYWVRRWEGSSRGPWEIAEWKRAWWLIGYSTPMSDAEMESIGRYFEAANCDNAYEEGQNTALRAWKDAQQATDDAVEHIERAAAEGWYNEPGGASHIADSERRADAAWVKAIALRDAALMGGEKLCPAPTLLEIKPNSYCSCPEETWEAFGSHLFMRLKAGKTSSAHTNHLVAGEREVTVTADTIDLARAAIFGWARALTTNFRLENNDD